MDAFRLDLCEYGKFLFCDQRLLEKLDCTIQQAIETDLDLLFVVNSKSEAKNGFRKIRLIEEISYGISKYRSIIAKISNYKRRKIFIAHSDVTFSYIDFFLVSQYRYLTRHNIKISLESKKALMVSVGGAFERLYGQDKRLYEALKSPCGIDGNQAVSMGVVQKISSDLADYQYSNILDKEISRESIVKIRRSPKYSFERTEGDYLSNPRWNISRRENSLEKVYQLCQEYKDNKSSERLNQLVLYYARFCQSYLDSDFLNRESKLNNSDGFSKRAIFDLTNKNPNIFLVLKLIEKGYQLLFYHQSSDFLNASMTEMFSELEKKIKAKSTTIELSDSISWATKVSSELRRYVVTVMFKEYANFLVLVDEDSYHFVASSKFSKSIGHIIEYNGLQKDLHPQIQALLGDLEWDLFEFDKQSVPIYPSIFILSILLEYLLFYCLSRSLSFKKIIHLLNEGGFLSLGSKSFWGEFLAKRVSVSDADTNELIGIGLNGKVYGLKDIEQVQEYIHQLSENIHPFEVGRNAGGVSSWVKIGLKSAFERLKPLVSAENEQIATLLVHAVKLDLDAKDFLRSVGQIPKVKLDWCDFIVSQI